MEQFRQIGEALGSLKALMEFRGHIQINERQCTLLFDISASAYTAISEAIKKNLNFEERHVKWKILEQPLREVHRTLKECEGYIKQCLEMKDWWAKAIFLHKNADCVELHVHNLLLCMATVIEAIETAGCEHEGAHKRSFVYMDKYRQEWKDPELFRWMFANQYLITQDLSDRMETVWREDRWILLYKLKKKVPINGKHEHRLAELLEHSLEDKQKVFPSSTLVGAMDYQVRRRLGSGSQYKEITWLGESWALRHFFGDIESQIPEISCLLSLSHPNVLQTFCAFADDEKRECFLVSELMGKDLGSHIKEVCGPRKRTLPFSLPVAVDLMLQIARGMEYLHSNRIHHGNLRPSSILVKGRSANEEGYLLAKVSSFGLSPVRSFTPRSPSSQSPFIWFAPEVLEEQEQAGSNGAGRFGEKADVYSFGMVCFEILTGKVPFDDSHLQGDKMSKNIRAGERPLFPPKLVSSLTKRCWHANPHLRPSFSSICRMLRYTKRLLLINSESDPPAPLVDSSSVEVKLSSRVPGWNSLSVGQIPYQIFMYRVAEREQAVSALKDVSDSGSDRASISEDEMATPADDRFPSPKERKWHSTPAEETFPSPRERKTQPSPEQSGRKPLQTKRWQDTRGPVQLGN